MDNFLAWMWMEVTSGTAGEFAEASGTCYYSQVSCWGAWHMVIGWLGFAGICWDVVTGGGIGKPPSLRWNSSPLKGSHRI
jgi:hypothetical protein